VYSRETHHRYTILLLLLLHTFQIHCNSEQEIFHSPSEHLHPCHRGFHEVNSHLISIIFISIKTEFYVVLLYNFKIIFYDKHFENIQAKHTTELISFFHIKLVFQNIS
jgi:hypothetical protein